MAFSRVGFNPQRSQALVCVGNAGRARGGEGYYVLLTKEAGTWLIIDMVVVWES